MPQMSGAYADHRIHRISCYHTYNSRLSEIMGNPQPWSACQKNRTYYRARLSTCAWPHVDRWWLILPDSSNRLLAAVTHSRRSCININSAQTARQVRRNSTVSGRFYLFMKDISLIFSTKVLHHILFFAHHNMMCSRNSWHTRQCLCMLSTKKARSYH